jgi:hypothetical protein
MPNIGPMTNIPSHVQAIPGKQLSKKKEIWWVDLRKREIHRSGRQQFGVIDYTSQTEDLGDDSMKAGVRYHELEAYRSN